MVSKRNDPRPQHSRAADEAAPDADAAAEGAPEDEEEDARPAGHRRSGGAGGFGPAIAGIMHGIDADIFRDPAAIRRMERDRTAIARTADGTMVGIELPGEGVIEDPDSEEDEPA
jgi:hypothetical protein